MSPAKFPGYAATVNQARRGGSRIKFRVGERREFWRSPNEARYRMQGHVSNGRYGRPGVYSR